MDRGHRTDVRALRADWEESLQLHERALRNRDRRRGWPLPSNGAGWPPGVEELYERTMRDGTPYGSRPLAAAPARRARAAAAPAGRRSVLSAEARTARIRAHHARTMAALTVSAFDGLLPSGVAGWVDLGSGR